MSSNFSRPEVFGSNKNHGISTCFGFCNSAAASDSILPVVLMSEPRSSPIHAYTDAEFAQDMNTLTFEEREEIIADIHGVASVIQETPEFIESKLQDFRAQITSNPTMTQHGKQYRAAWDRAIFLRPSLETDRDHHLMFLRARRFDTVRAAKLLLNFYHVRRRVWGDKLVHQLVGWDDLSSEAQAALMSGVTIFFPKNRMHLKPHNVAYFSAEALDLHVHSPEAIAKATVYPFDWTARMSPELQRMGCIVVADLRGTWRSPGMHLIHCVSQINPLLESLPLHCAAFHFLCEEDSFQWLKGLQKILTKKGRVRVRLHSGSWTEIQYSLRTFGIDISSDPLHRKGCFSSEALEQHVMQWRKSESQWRKSESLHQSLESSVALYPNPQDIIMGNNKTVAPTWLGNLAYKRIIQTQAHHYLRAEARREKTELTLQIIDHVHSTMQGRFLVRKDSRWEVADTSDVQLKVSQALRNEVRALSMQMTDTTA